MLNMTIEIYRVETAMSVAPTLRLRPEKEKEGTHACAAVAVMARTITCLRILASLALCNGVANLSASLDLSTFLELIFCFPKVSPPPLYTRPLTENVLRSVKTNKMPFSNLNMNPNKEVNM
jgi:hypothetical protein